jgi:hypothetical protein
MLSYYYIYLKNIIPTITTKIFQFFNVHPLSYLHHIIFTLNKNIRKIKIILEKKQKTTTPANNHPAAAAAACLPYLFLSISIDLYLAVTAIYIMIIIII